MVLSERNALESRYFNTCMSCEHKITKNIYSVFLSYTLSHHSTNLRTSIKKNNTLAEYFDLDIIDNYAMLLIKRELLEVKKSYDIQNLTKNNIDEIKGLIIINEKENLNLCRVCTEIDCKIKNRKSLMNGENNFEVSGNALIKEITNLTEELHSNEKAINNLSKVNADLKNKLAIINRSKCILLILNHFIEITPSIQYLEEKQY